MQRFFTGVLILLLIISVGAQEKQAEQKKKTEKKEEVKSTSEQHQSSQVDTSSAKEEKSEKKMEPKEKKPKEEKPANDKTQSRKKKTDDISPEQQRLEYAAVPPKFETELPGGILFGNFDSTSSPFLISGSIIIPSGQKLEFGPGCKVYMGGEYPTITVFGQLMVRGTKEKPVLFRSAKRNPKPWDWDRIYCRSRNRSVFENCIIQHCNYGVFIENGAATVENCIFEQNSLHGLVVRNSDVSILGSMFHKGHVLALFCQEGAKVRAESLKVVNNITGIACGEKSTFDLRGGEIAKNTNGIVVMDNAAVTIVAADVTHNRKGLVSLVDIPKKVREMVYANSIDFQVISKGEMEKVLKPPEEVKSIVLPKTKTKIDVGEDFRSGFSATQAPREQTVSFMGNVSVGFKYFMPTSHTHTIRYEEFDTVTSGADSGNISVRYLTKDTLVKQTRYPGEHSDEVYAGIQPEMQIFASGRRKGADINLLVDLYGNDWIDQPLHMRKNTFNLSMNYYDQHLVVGDFFESSSKTSLESRKFTGVRYTGEYMPMGKGVKRFATRLAAGETEFPKDLGDNDITLYNDTVDTGMSIRQQMTYLAGLTIKPTINSAINIKGIIARDQGYEPLFRDVLSDPEAPDPIEAQTGVIDGNVTLLDDRLTLNLEFDVGVHDTLDSADTEQIGEIAWYDPKIGKAVTNVFEAIPDKDLEHWAMSVGARGMVSGFDLAGSFTRIGPEYFSAGNPYLEADRYIFEMNGEKSILENLSSTAGYEYEMRYASNEFNLATDESGPTHVNTFDIGAEYTYSPRLPSVGIDYSFILENSEEPGEHYTYSYTHDTLMDTSTGDTVYTITTTTNTDTAALGYNEVDLKNIWGIEFKQRFDNGINYSLKYRALWENELTEYPNPELVVEDDGWQHQISGRFAFKYKRLLRNTTTFKVTTKMEDINEVEALSYKFANKLKITAIPRKLSFLIKGDYSNRTEDESEFIQVGDDYDMLRVTTDTESYGAELEAKYSISSKLSLSLMGRYEESTDETEGSTENYDVIIGGLHVTYLF